MRTRQTPAERARKARSRRLVKLYGITADQYDEMLAAQDGRCALCGRKNKHMAVDHAHYLPYPNVRAIVCRIPCNRDVIAALDAQGPAGYRRAIELLISYRAQRVKWSTAP